MMVGFASTQLTAEQRMLDRQVASAASREGGNGEGD